MPPPNRPHQRWNVVGLTKVYGSGNAEVVAMRNVSLRLEPGERPLPC